MGSKEKEYEEMCQNLSLTVDKMRD